jgi:hypothetical protein
VGAKCCSNSASAGNLKVLIVAQDFVTKVQCEGFAIRNRAAFVVNRATIWSRLLTSDLNRRRERFGTIPTFANLHSAISDRKDGMSKKDGMAEDNMSKGSMKRNEMKKQVSITPASPEPSPRAEAGFCYSVEFRLPGVRPDVRNRCPQRNAID